MTTATPIRVVLAGGSPIVLACLKQLFAREGDLEVVATCGDGCVIAETIQSENADILLFDLPLRPEAWLATLRQIKELKLKTRVVLLGALSPEDELPEAFRLGVRGAVPKEIAPAMLADCIRRVHGGHIWIGDGRAARAASAQSRSAGPAGARFGLTSREIEIVRHISAGLRNKQIAQRLRISEGTVKSHLHQIYEKLGLRGRLQLSLYGHDAGLTGRLGPFEPGLSDRGGWL